MSKEQLLNFKELPEAELRARLKEAQLQKNYEQELELCIALYQYEENPCMASTYIKELEAYLAKIASKKSAQGIKE